MQQGPDVKVYAQMTDGQERIASLVGQIHAVQVDGVAKIGAKLGDAHLCVQLVAQVSFGAAGHKILARGKLQHHHHPNNKQQHQG